MKAILLGTALVFTLATGSVAKDSDSTAAGAAVAAAGDCVACHTAEGGKPFAGGLPMQTPMGTIYSTNITPSSTGIGGYSFQDFSRAVREGVARDGRQLYPAMPYPSYSRVTDQDMQTLYNYMMHGVAPVDQPNRPGNIPWPLSIRWPLMFWNWTFAHEAPFAPTAGQDAQWNRGAYLVEGLGHCGSCHTPRALTMQEKAMTPEGGADYLAGAEIDGWLAKSLRGGDDGLGKWTEADIAEFLKTGRNAHTAAFGGMTEVVTHSTQHMPDTDVAAIAHFLKSLPGGNTGLITAAGDTYKQLQAGTDSKPGAAVYGEFCISCHRADGAGYARIFPALGGNSAVVTGDPVSLARIVLAGGRMAETPAPRFAMPGFAYLSDQDVASVLSFIRGSWGNRAASVTADQVAAVRKAAAVAAEDRPIGVPATFAPPRDADIAKQANAALILEGERLMTQTKRLLPDYVGDGLNCTSCHLEEGKVAFASPLAGQSHVYPSYNGRAARIVDLRERINGCFLRSMNGKPVPPQSHEMDAMVAYFDWLSAPIQGGAKFAGRGLGKIDQKLVPNADNGHKVYDQQCAACHGSDGQGLKDSHGEYVFPPLWGDDSFNIGAGIARTYTAAAFVYNNMPVGHGLNGRLGQGKALSQQEAVDVAEYFTHQPRPDFPPKVNDWPKGGKPADARY